MDENINETTAQDVEGHRRLPRAADNERRAIHTNVAGDNERRSLQTNVTGDDDVEGHRILPVERRSLQTNVTGDDDVEGHRRVG